MTSIFRQVLFLPFRTQQCSSEENFETELLHTSTQTHKSEFCIIITIRRRRRIRIRIIIIVTIVTIITIVTIKIIIKIIKKE